MRLLFALGGLLGLSASGLAQASLPAIEISPFAGYFIGGTFDNLVFSQKFSDELIYGARIGWNVTPRIEPEFEWSRTQPELTPAANLVPITLDYYLGGASYNFGDPTTRPYVSMDVGVGQFAFFGDPHNLFTASLGVGIKHFLTPNFGVRLDARGYASATDDALKSVCTTFAPGGSGGPVEPTSCVRSWLFNAGVTGGLVIAF
jgi:hypothetical protein